MTPIIIIIALIIIISCFTFGFLYNEVFLYAASVLAIIFGLILLINGVNLPSGEATTNILNEITNQTTSTSVTQYEIINDHLTQGIGLIFILIGIAFTYFEKKGRNEGKDQNGLSGVWG